jgi:integrase
MPSISADFQRFPFYQISLDSNNLVGTFNYAHVSTCCLLFPRLLLTRCLPGPKMKAKLTPAFVSKVQPPRRGDRIVYWDENLPCFGLMVTRSGHKSFVVQYRAQGISRRLTFKAEPRGGLSLDKAKREARAVIGAVAKGGDPLADQRKATRAAENTLQAVAEEFLAREGIKFRTNDQRRATLERLIFPKLGARQIAEIRRSEITRLLDQIANERGLVMADSALASLRRIMNWHEARSDDFNSPIRRGMTRTSQTDRRRQRILRDDELRAVWQAVEADPSAFGHMLQFLMLTATRRNEAARMKHNELSGAEWTIPKERYKTGMELLIPLSPAATGVLKKTPKIGREYVFTTDGKGPISGFSKLKSKFDKACGVTGWALHDLRRTARSLMSRAGVSSDHAERCLGHVMSGIRGTYDKHEYRDEKRRAFEALASLVGQIIDPQTNVVPLKDRHVQKA